MGVDYLEYFEVIKRVLGLSTTFNEVEEVCTKIFPSFYPLLFLAINCFDIIYVLCRSTFSANPIYTSEALLLHRVVRSVFVVYSLCVGLEYNKRKTTTTMKLLATKQHLASLNMNIPKSNCEKSIVLLCAVVYILHISETVMFCISTYVYNEGLLTYDIVIITYHDLIKCTFYFGYMLFFSNIFRVQKALNKEVQNLVEKNEGETLPVFSVQRRLAWDDRVDLLRDRLTLIKAVQTVLSTAGRDLRSSFWVFITWISLVSAVYIPSVTLPLFRTAWHIWGINVAMGIYLAFLLTIVVSQTELHAYKLEANESLSSLLMSKTGYHNQRIVKHQIRGLFINSGYLDCYFFDVDYSLLLCILETIAMVACTMFSNVN